MLKYKVEYYLVLLLEKFIMLFPKKFRKAFFIFLGNIVYLLNSKNKDVIRKNLLYVYNDNISDAKIKEIQKECYKKLFLNILSIIENEYITDDELDSIITFKNKEYLKEVQKNHNSFIYITAHFGNIDLLGLVIGKKIGKMVQVQQKLNNPYLTEHMRQKRETYNLEIVEKHGAIKKLFLALKNNKPISLIIDQNVKIKYASKVTFLNKETYQTNSTSNLALKLDVPILPIFIRSIDNEKYEVIFKKPIYPKGKTEYELTQLQADVMSEMIFKYPKEWFWCHKRFKNSNPSLYQN